MADLNGKISKALETQGQTQKPWKLNDKGKCYRNLFVNLTQIPLKKTEAFPHRFQRYRLKKCGSFKKADPLIFDCFCFESSS